MIFTLYLLLILALIILIFQKNFTIFLQKHTKHSTTINMIRDFSLLLIILILDPNINT